MGYCDQCGKELQENEVCNCQKEKNYFINNANGNGSINCQKPVKRTGNYLTAIIYPLLFCILALFIYSIEETSMLGVILAICVNIAGGYCILKGGFYFVIIPLPYVFFYRAGCTKPDLSTGKKVLFGILSFVLLFGSIAILFLFR